MNGAARSEAGYGELRGKLAEKACAMTRGGAQEVDAWTERKSTVGMAGNPLVPPPGFGDQYQGSLGALREEINDLIDDVALLRARLEYFMVPATPANESPAQGRVGEVTSDAVGALRVERERLRYARETIGDVMARLTI